MTTPTPAEELRAGAVRARKIGDSLYTALADWLDAAAVGYDATVKGAAGVWTDPADAAERDAWVARQTDQHALAVARQVLGTPTTDTAPCRCPHPADEHSVYGCADGCGCEWMPPKSASAAPQPEPCPCAVGVASDRCSPRGCAPVSVPAAPADRATVLREAAATVENLPVPNTSPGWVRGATWVLDQIRRLADEAQPTETEACTCQYIAEPWIKMQHSFDCPAATAATGEPQP